ncbi:MAG: sugar transferase, partial [Melioribacteraceae bacterium]
MDKKTEKFLILITDFIAVNVAWLLFFYLRVQTGWFDVIAQPDVLLSMIAVYFYWLVIFTF